MLPGPLRLDTGFVGRRAQLAESPGIALRARGMRATPARQVLLTVLGELGHGTPEELFEAAASRLPGLSLSTVYRGLDSLNEAGIVQHAHFHGSTRSYFLAEHANHAHLVCEQCGQVISLDDGVIDELLTAMQAEHGYVVDPAHIALVGTCAPCAARSA
jgi:Fur family ferric uptake transcriptional regulator